jgi:poly-gamma-glutamate capsule biosynthesis protein CapA/YwtB (metallophosphatase superfamily)
MKTLNSLLAAALLLGAASQSLAAEPGAAPAAPPHTESGDLLISAVGDMMLDASSRPVISGMGYNYPFAEVRRLFKGSQVIFGNLEGPLTDRGTAETDKKFTFRSPPDKVSAALKNAGFTVVSLANNHMLDYGPDGLAQTIDTLDAAGIKHAGAGADLAAARQPAIIEAGGKKIAVLAYSITLPENFYAAAHKPGTAFAREEQVREDVMAARKQADIVLVSFHWGQEGKTVLRDYQKSIGHLAIDSGADAVIGSHPHILQGIEHYKNGVILYSMGNFTFGSYSSHSTRSAVAQLRFHNGRLAEVKMFPINVNNFEVAFQPKPLQGKEADAVIAGLAKLSAERHTVVRDDHGVGVVSIQQ